MVIYEELWPKLGELNTQRIKIYKASHQMPIAMRYQGYHQNE